jgi:hypothetical protein
MSKILKIHLYHDFLSFLGLIYYDNSLFMISTHLRNCTFEYPPFGCLFPPRKLQDRYIYTYIYPHNPLSVGETAPNLSALK